MPVLTPGSTPLRVLHLSDIHMRPSQRRKQEWLRELARWEPDLVVNTGDNLSHPKAVPAVVQALGDLLSVPGFFVFGSNDYFAPRLKNPAKYLTDSDQRVHGKPLPWQDLRAAFNERGWGDLTHNRRELEVAGVTIAAAGVDDPHLDRDRYETIAGPDLVVRVRPDVVLIGAAAEVEREHRGLIGKVERQFRGVLIAISGHPLIDRPRQKVALPAGIDGRRERLPSVRAGYRILTRRNRQTGVAACQATMASSIAATARPRCHQRPYAHGFSPVASSMIAPG